MYTEGRAVPAAGCYPWGSRRALLKSPNTRRALAQVVQLVVVGHEPRPLHDRGVAGGEPFPHRFGVAVGERHVRALAVAVALGAGVAGHAGVAGETAGQWRTHELVRPAAELAVAEQRGVL